MGFQHTRYGVKLLHKNLPKLHISVPTDILAQQGLKNWIIQNFEDLTEGDKILEEIKQMPEFGATEEERVTSVKKTNLQLMLFTPVVFFFILYKIIFLQQSVFIICAGLCLPLGFLYFVYVKKGLVGLYLGKDDEVTPMHPMTLMIVLGCLGWDAFSYHLLDYFQTLIPAVFFAALFGLAGFVAIRKNLMMGTKTTRIHETVVLLISAAIYGYFATIIINCTFDQSIPQKRITQVVEKIRNEGIRRVTVTLNKKEVKLYAGFQLFEQLKPGDKITVYQKQGVLNIPWIVKITK